MAGTDLAKMSVKVTPEGVIETANDLREMSKWAGHAQKKVSGLSKAWSVANKVFLSVGAAIVTKQLIDMTVAAVRTGLEFERLSVQMSGVMGSLQEGERATAWIEKFAKDTPLELLDVSNAFVRLKAMGIDPMNGSLKAIVDTNAKLGSSNETLQTITLALGKAWGRGKMEMEDANMMLEKGINVYRILGDVMGYDEAQMRKFQTEGKITRDVVALLIDEMGRLNEGQAVAFMETGVGKMSNLSDAVARAQKEFALMGGVVDEVGRAMSILTDYIEELESSGVFQTMGKEVAEFLGKFVDYLPDIIAGIESLVKTFWEWRGFIKDIAKHIVTLWAVQRVVAFLVKINLAWKALKIVKQSIQELVIAMERFALATAKATTATAKFGLAVTKTGIAAGKGSLGIGKMIGLLYKFEIASTVAVMAAQGLSMWLNTLAQSHLKAGGEGSADWLEGYARRVERLYKLTKDASVLSVDFEDKDQRKSFLSQEKYIDRIIEKLKTKQALDQTQTRTYLRNKKAMDAYVAALIAEEKAQTAAVDASKEAEEAAKRRAELEEKALAALEAKTNAEEAAREAEKAWRKEMARNQYEAEKLIEHWKIQIDQFKRLNSLVEMSEQQWAAMGREIKQVVDFTSNLPVIDLPIAPPPIKAFREFAMIELPWVAQQMESTLGDALYLGFTGRLDEIGDVLANFFNQIASGFATSISNQLMNMFKGEDKQGNMVGEGSFTEAFEATDFAELGSELGMAVGAGMVAHAVENGNVWGAVLGGALAGGMAGLPVGGVGAPVGAAIGAVMGAISYMMSRQQTERSMAYISPYGTSSGFRGQDFDNAQVQQFNAEIAGLYKRFDAQYRDILRLFDDIDLFALVGDVVTVATDWMDMTADQFKEWLVGVKLPEIFDSRYFTAISTGLENLGAQREVVQLLFREIGKLEGEDRLAALQAYIQAVTLLAEYINEGSWDDLVSKVDDTPFANYVIFMTDTIDQIDLITAAWDNMSLTERAGDVEAIGGLFETSLTATISLLQQIDAMSKAIGDQIDRSRESLEFRTMAPMQQGEYLYQQINDLFAALNDPELKDPQVIQDLTTRLLDYINRFGQLFPDTDLDTFFHNWGMMGEFDIGPQFEAWVREMLGDQDGAVSIQDWILTQLSNLDDASTEALGRARDEAQELYDTLYARINDVNDGLLEMDETLTGLNEVLRTTGGLLGGDGGGRQDGTLPGDLKGLPIGGQSGSQVVEIPPPVINVTINGVPLAQIDAMVKVAVSQSTPKPSSGKLPPLR